MHIASQLTPTTESRITTTRNGPFLLRLLNWIVEANRQYREKQKLQKMPDERLADMGLTRKEANTAFYRQVSRVRDLESLPISTRW